MAKTSILLLLILGLVACSQKVPVQRSPTSSDEKPNVVIVMTDDQGWGDVGFVGNQDLQTPELDELRNSGVLFEQFQVSPVCSPTRASILTGRHSLRTGVWSVTRGGEKMRTEEVTIAEILKDNGYRTGLFGKWHNGAQAPFTPNHQGFEEFFGFVDGHITRYFDGQILENETITTFDGYLPDAITDRAITFIEAKRPEPFLAFVSYNTPHSPFELPESLFETYRNRGLTDLDASVYGMMENISNNVGRIQAAIHKSGATENTLVVFLSDNGPAFPGGNQRFNGGMKGHKGSVDMGGVRVPLIFSWPERIPSASTSSVLSQHIDLLPTILELAGIEASVESIDGVSLAPAVLHPNSQWTPNKRMLFTHHFRNTQRPDQNPIEYGPGSVRHGNWYATVDHSERWSLYNLEDDPSQSEDLSTAEPNRLSQLISAYTDWFVDVSLDMPRSLAVPMPNYSASIFFPAHEAHVRGDSIDYAYEAGWSHDWLIATGINDEGGAFWFIEPTEDIETKITIEYAAPNGDLPAGVLWVGTDKSDFVPVPALGGHVPSIDRGLRKFETGEAPSLSWAKTHINVTLPERANLLEIRVADDVLPGSLQIKSLRLDFQN